MKKLISARTTGDILLVALGALALFHVLMLLGVLPPDMAWGGRTGSSPGSLVLLEVVALVVTALFAAIVAARSGRLGSLERNRFVRFGAWVVFGYFTLNILGNLASSSMLEKAIFVPLSILLALLAFRLAMED